MSLSTEDVKKIARLARLKIGDGDVTGYAKELSGILDFVDQLERVDTSGVEPMAHPLDQPQRLRKDEVTEESQRELYQSISPEVEKGLFLVPKVIE